MTMSRKDEIAKEINTIREELKKSTGNAIAKIKKLNEEYNSLTPQKIIVEHLKNRYECRILDVQEQHKGTIYTKLDIMQEYDLSFVTRSIFADCGYIIHGMKQEGRIRRIWWIKP